MILRVWRSEIRREDCDDYVRHVERTGLVAHRAAAGNLGASIAARDLDEVRSEIVTLSYWRDLDEVAAFVGEPIDAARYYPDDASLLTRPDTVAHYEVVVPPVGVSEHREHVAEGGCACGGVRFVATGEPLRAGLCHCMTCRKAHGAAFNPFVVFGRGQVRLEGETRAWRSSPEYRRLFCPACGSRVAGEIDGSDEIELTLGGFDRPGRFAPEYESWIRTREPWLPPLPLDQYLGARPQRG